MKDTPHPLPTPSPGTYTPGYGRQKLAMIVGGLILMLLGLTQLSPPLRLLAFGGQARAEATDVIKIKEGLPEQVLTSDLQIKNQEDPGDRSYVYWNEFRFQTDQGRVVVIRAPVGSELRPLYPLTDEDGLPTSDLVVYDKAHPKTVAFPMIVSTWFAPGMLFVIGAVCTLIGSFLFYWAEKPIELPKLTQ